MADTIKFSQLGEISRAQMAGSDYAVGYKANGDNKKWTFENQADFLLNDSEAGQEFQETFVKVQDAEPTDENNKIWVKETPENEVEVPTYEEFEDVVEDVEDLKSAIEELKEDLDFTFITLEEGDADEVKNNTGISTTGALETRSGVKTWLYKIDTGYKVSCTVGLIISADSLGYISFYSDENATQYIPDSGVFMAAASGVPWNLSANVPKNCKCIAIASRTNSLSTPTINIVCSLCLENKERLDSVETTANQSVETLADMGKVLTIDDSDSILHYYCAYDTGSQTNSNAFNSYVFENKGYKKVYCKVGLANTAHASIAYYSGDVKVDNFLSGVQAVSGIAEYLSSVPADCKNIVVFNRTATYATPSAVIYADQSEYGNRIINNSKSIDALNERISAVESAEETDIVYLNQDIKGIINSSSARSGRYVSGKEQHEFLTLLWGSDFHGDSYNFSRMIKLGKVYDVFDAIITTGDYCITRFMDAGFEQCYASNYQDAAKPVLPVIGNHDTGISKSKESITIGGVTTFNTIAGCVSRFISPYMTYNECVQGNSGGYYYKDFADYKVRIITLFEYEMPRIDDPNDSGKYLYEYWNRYLSQDQVDWFVSTLNSTPADYSVIVLMHQIPNTLTEWTTDKFNSNGFATFTNGQGTIVQDIVDAYISKTSLVKTYSNTIGALTTDLPDVTVDADFSSANGEFVCYLVGHTHCDKIGTVANTNNYQLVICMTTSGTNKQQYDDLWRAVGTKSQDCLNMIVVDTVSKRIRILRIGANTTLDMTWRDMESVPYVSP